MWSVVVWVTIGQFYAHGTCGETIPLDRVPVRGRRACAGFVANSGPLHTYLTNTDTALRLAIVVLAATAAAGFFWFDSGSAQGWPVYLLAVLLPVYWQAARARLAEAHLIHALLGWAIVSLAWSDVSALERVRALGWFVCLYAWIMALAAIAGDRRAVAAYHGAVLIAAAASAAAAIAFWPVAPGERLHGFGRVVNAAVAAFVWGGAAIVGIRIAARPDVARVWRSGAVVCVAILAAATVLAETRAAVAALICLGAAMLAGRLRGWWLVAAAAGAVGLFVVFVVALDVPLLGDSPRSIGHDPRVSIWRDAISARPLWQLAIGAGAASSEAVTLTDGVRWDHAHGLFLSLYLQLGVPGVALILAVIGMALRRAFAGRDELALDIGLWSLAWCVLVGVLDGHAPFGRIDHLWMLLWAPLAFCLAGGASPGDPRHRSIGARGAASVVDVVGTVGRG